MHGVWAGAIKGFDAEMLLDPFEEQFDLPAAAIQLGDGPSRDGEVVGEEDQRLAGMGITIANTPQRVRIIVLGLGVGQHHSLVKAQAGGFVHRAGVAAGATEVLLGAGDEESAALMEPMPLGEVKIAAIQDIERAGGPDELGEEVDVMHTGRGDNNDGGKVALQGQQRVEFDSALVRPKRRPGKERQAQINGGGIQSIGGGLEFKAKRFGGVERGGLPDQHLREVGEEVPVPFFVGVGQRAAGGGRRMPA